MVWITENATTMHTIPRQKIHHQQQRTAIYFLADAGSDPILPLLISLAIVSMIPMAIWIAILENSRFLASRWSDNFENTNCSARITFLHEMETNFSSD